MFNRHKDKTLQWKWSQPRAAVFRLRSRLGAGFWLLADVRRRTSRVRLRPPNSSQTPDTGKPKQDVPAEAGGPTDSVGPYAIPKKKAEDAPPPPPPVAPKKLEDIPDYSLKVNVPLVNVDVLVTTKDGQFIPGLKEGNFRILEDGVPQKVTHFNVSQAPITAVLLVEFASTTLPFLVDTHQCVLCFRKHAEEG